MDFENVNDLRWGEIDNLSFPSGTPGKRKRQIRAQFARQLEGFRAKFGREPLPHEPVFFDERASEPRKMSIGAVRSEALAVMDAINLPGHLKYAFIRTGLIVSEDGYALLPPDERRRWDEAIDEYEALQAKGQS